MANYPDRCQHLKINGTQCGSPALRRNRFCYFHKRFQDERIRLTADRKRHGVGTFILPLLEDANSIQIALMQVMRLVVSQQIEQKTASLLLYALQTASTNLRLTDFKPAHHQVILDPRATAETPLGEHQLWSDDDFDEDDDEEEAETEKPFDPDAYLLEKRRKRQEEQDRKDLKTLNYFKQWSEDHPGSKLICDEGTLKILVPQQPAQTPALPPPVRPQPQTPALSSSVSPARPQSNPVSATLPEKKKPESEKSIPELRKELVNLVVNSGVPEMYAAEQAKKQREEKKTS